MDEISSPTYFGAWLKYRRKTLDLTQAELSQRAGCSLPALRKIEAGTRRPSKQLAGLLAQSLQISANNQTIFIKVARGELALERLPDPAYLPFGDSQTARKPTSSPGNLPLELSSFIGREDQIEFLTQQLREGAHRLLTLTGAGGTGKTRLGLQVCAKMRDVFPDGVWLVELAPLGDPCLVVKTVAQVLGIHEIPGVPILITLSTYLKSRSLLLMLDNCEHLLDACCQLANHLLRECPKLVLLVTSREALNITGETAYRIPSMEAPDPDTISSLKELAQVESVRLFAERAAAVLPGFSLSAETLSVAARLCHRLDGIPLAIELAAARVTVLSIEEINARLDDRFHLLTGGSRTSLPRQRTLRASIDWSYNLLSEEERLLFQRLSVFSGGWNLPAAEAVSAGEGLRDGAILDILTGLVAKSLVIAGSQSGAETRYRMLETIRQYAQERLEGAGQEASLRDRHLAYFLSLAEDYEPLLRTPKIYELLEHLNIELDNLRGALSWTLGKNNRTGAEQALRILSSLFYYWWLRKIITETDGWVRRALNLLPETDSEASCLRAWSLLLLAKLKIRSGYVVKEQLDHVNMSISLFQQACHLPESRLKLAFALATRMDIIYRFLWFFPPEPPIQKEAAQKDREESLALVNEFITPMDLKNRWIVSWIYLIHADYERNALEADQVAFSKLKKIAHDLSMRLGDQVVQLNILRLLSNSYIHLDPYQSIEYANQGITLAKRLGDEASMGFFYERLGLSAYLTRQFFEMEHHFCKVEEIFHHSVVANPVWGETWITRMQGVAAVNQQDAEKAQTLLLKAMHLAINNEDPNGIVSALIHLAGLALLRKQNPDAAMLLGFIERQYEGFFKEMDLLPDRPEYETHKNQTRERLSKANFATLWEEGRAMSIEQAIQLAEELAGSEDA